MYQESMAYVLIEKESRDVKMIQGENDSCLFNNKVQMYAQKRSLMKLRTREISIGR